MQFEAEKDIFLSDTLIPDVFLSDILPEIPPEAVKVYLYCIFLSKYGKEARTEDLAAKLSLSVDAIQAAFFSLEHAGLIIRTPQVLTIVDIKEREVSRLFKRKATSEPQEALARTSMNVKRNQCMDSINKMFFQGMMSPSWYTNIDNWFEQCRFEEDVMVALFKYCYDNNALNARYIEKVAATWAQKGISTHWELEAYMENREKTMEAAKHITRALRLGRNLTTYEERYLETWLHEFHYGMDIIELALEKTASKASPNFKYLHGILSAWHQEGIKTKEQVVARSEAAAGTRTEKEASGKVAKRNNFVKHTYDDAFFEKLNNITLDKKGD